MKSRFLLFILTFVLLAGSINAQRADVSIVVGDSFFDAFLESLFKNFDGPTFTIGSTGGEDVEMRRRGGSASVSNAACDQNVKIIREIDGVRTAVRFRDGKIYVPLAFTGEYALPIVGCVEYAGWAESLVDLDFDRATQRLNARVRVTNVNLSGSNGIGGSTIARLLQSSLDKRMNPIEVMRVDQLVYSFAVQDSGRMKIRAVDVKPVVQTTNIVIIVTMEFDRER